MLKLASYFLRFPILFKFRPLLLYCTYDFIELLTVPPKRKRHRRRKKDQTKYRRNFQLLVATFLSYSIVSKSTR